MSKFDDDDDSVKERERKVIMMCLLRAQFLPLVLTEMCGGGRERSATQCGNDVLISTNGGRQRKNARGKRERGNKPDFTPTHSLAHSRPHYVQ